MATMHDPVNGDYGRLWRARPALWFAAAAASRRLARRLADAAVEIAGQIRALRPVWSGPAASAAIRRLRGIHDRLDTGRIPLIAADQVLAEHADRIVEAKALLAATVEATANTRVAVDRHGRVSVTTLAATPQDLGAARLTAQHVREALDLAAQADTDTTNRLTELATWWTDPRPHRPGADPPSPGTTPTAVHAWWAGLSGTQRRWLVLHRPELIGSLDGIPTVTRDQANRLLLDRLGEAAHPRLEALRARLDRVEPPRAYLLRLDSTGDGRAVIAIGNPDRAEHVLVQVPGAGADLAGVSGELTRVDRIVARAAQLAPTERTSAVLWLDYDAPDDLREAAQARSAHHAGAALQRFVDGLRATGQSHVTVLGHSYGSLVVGATARDHGLAADDVVFVGSPGVGVSHVDGLHLNSDHVWSTTSRHDPIQYAAPSLAQAGRDLARSALAPRFAGVPLVLPDEDLWHGHNPSRRDFGGRVFTSDGDRPMWTAHGGYWEAGALDNIVRITLGGAYQARVN